MKFLFVKHRNFCPGEHDFIRSLLWCLALKNYNDLLCDSKHLVIHGYFSAV